jgi:hypothetical protein
MFYQRTEWNFLAGGLKGKRLDACIHQALEGEGGLAGSTAQLPPSIVFGMRHMALWWLPPSSLQITLFGLQNARMAFNTLRTGESTLTLVALNPFVFRNASKR